MAKSLYIVVALSISTILWLSSSDPIETIPPPPPGAMGSYLNGIFPDSKPGASGQWFLEDPFPDLSIIAPLRIIPFVGSEDVLVLSKSGEVWRVSFEAQTKELILDIKDRAFKKGEAGTAGMVLHPKFGNPSFPDKQYIVIFYRTKPDADIWDEKGFNRLSKFFWDENSQTFDLSSEEVLIQQYDRSTWHNGGGMFFGPDELLYVSFGDEGMEDFTIESSQRLDGGIFSGIIRIDVDNDPSRSHPIRRQPISLATPAAGWGETFSQGYSIPNDNPWLDVDGNILEEFYAIGVRSPYSMVFDELEQRIWLADVGSDKREEINWVEKGDNLQWPYLEGTRPSDVFEEPQTIIGNKKEVIFEYSRTELGSCIIGGTVYRGANFPNLFGKYLFADFTRPKLVALKNYDGLEDPEVEILIENLDGQPVDMPATPGITGIFPQANGEILVTVKGEASTTPGKIFRLQSKALIPDPPSLLSELGVFENLETLETVQGIIPYSVNAPLWSDGATKQRWMALPNDGFFDSETEQIKFNINKEWDFPPGTVFIKQFNLPLSDVPSGPVAKVETRFFIIGKDGVGYGLSYIWNEEGTDATLAIGSAEIDFDIYENSAFSHVQTWSVPSRSQCIDCHTSNANYVLGLQTHQLNGNLDYPEVGVMNQLDYLNQINAFDKKIGDENTMPRAFALTDNTASLDIRIRSYLDANCASCHRQNGVSTVSQDLRFNVALPLMNIINFSAQSHASDLSNKIVEPGNHQDSELWIRDASLEENKMPPLGKNIVDQVYIDSLAKWIDQLTLEDGRMASLIIYPNPTSDFLTIRVSDDWKLPVEINIYAANGQFLFHDISQSRSHSIDVDFLGAGKYVMKISNADNQQTKKFTVY